MKAEPGRYAVAGSSVRGVIGRNADTGRFVLAPLSKPTKKGRDAAKIVSEVKHAHSKGRPDENNRNELGKNRADNMLIRNGLKDK